MQTTAKYWAITIASTILLIDSGARAQTLFGSNNGYVYEFSSTGVPSTFSHPGTPVNGLAFGGVGNQTLFAATEGDTVNVFSSSGTPSTYVSGAGDSTRIAFDNTGDLFVTTEPGNIFKYAPGGAKSTFASGLSSPQGLAFDSAGDLFVAGHSSPGGGYIYEYTTNGTRTTFTTDVNNPIELAFNAAGDLFEADNGSGNVYEFTSGTSRITYATGISGVSALAFDNNGDLFASGTSAIYEITPGDVQSVFSNATGTQGLAVQGVVLPVPEPSSLGLLALGGVVALIRRRKQ